MCSAMDNRVGNADFPPFIIVVTDVATRLQYTVPRKNNKGSQRGSGARVFHFLTALSAGFMAMMPASSVTNLPDISKDTAVPALGTIRSLREKRISR